MATERLVAKNCAGLSAALSTLLRDIVRATPKTEDALTARIKYLPKGGMALGGLLVTAMEGNLQRDPHDPERASSAAAIALKHKSGKGVAQGLAMEGSISTAAMARKIRAAVLRGGKAPAATTPKELVDRVGETSYAKKLSQSMSEQARRDVQGLKKQLAAGSSQPGIGMQRLGKDIFEFRGRNGGRIIALKSGEKRFEIIGEFQGHKRGDASNSRIIRNLINDYRKRNAK